MAGDGRRGWRGGKSVAPGIAPVAAAVGDGLGRCRLQVNGGRSMAGGKGVVEGVGQRTATCERGAGGN